MKYYDVAIKSGRVPGWQTNKGKRLKMVWVTIEDGYLYLSHTNGGKYWVLRNVAPQHRPRIRASDTTNTLWINTFGIRFKSKRQYQYAKRSLLPYTRGSRFRYGTC